MTDCTARRKRSARHIKVVIGVIAILVTATACASTPASTQKPPSRPATTKADEVKTFTLRVPQVDHMGEAGYTNLRVTLECIPSRQVQITLYAKDARDDLLLTVTSEPHGFPVKGWRQVRVDMSRTDLWRRTTGRICLDGLSHGVDIEVMTRKQREQYGIKEKTT
ncbi:hypothetical protein ACFWJU_18620 [Streptomyces mutabilis]|uniref:hypothetical protein n=1 Tax=Streptomyces mutabilis TaxID=67332 RepID=UPI0036557DA0